MTASGQIVVLNGAPRSGKTSIAHALQEASDEPWINLGVDSSMGSTPEQFQPGIGLRPGGERPDLEDLVVLLYAALYESVAAHSRLGLRVVVDVGHHDEYARPLHVWRACARLLSGQPVLLVGVRCPVEEIRRRRAESWGQPEDTAGTDLADAVRRWQEAVHTGVSYDLEVDTSLLSPAECAERIVARLTLGPPGSALTRAAEGAPGA